MPLRIPSQFTSTSLPRALCTTPSPSHTPRARSPPAAPPLLSASRPLPGPRSFRPAGLWCVVSIAADRASVTGAGAALPSLTQGRISCTAAPHIDPGLSQGFIRPPALRGGGAHSAQPQDTNYWAPRTRKRPQQEHRPQRPTESSDPTQHAKGRTGDCPGPRKGTTTRRNVTQGGGVERASGTFLQGLVVGPDRGRREAVLAADPATRTAPGPEVHERPRAGHVCDGTASTNQKNCDSMSRARTPISTPQLLSDDALQS